MSQYLGNEDYPSFAYLSKRVYFFRSELSHVTPNIMSSSQTQSSPKTRRLDGQEVAQEIQELRPLLPKMEGQNILVLGDLGLDEYVMGQVRRISPEAPVPVVEVETEDYRAGLAANVAQNIAALGGCPFLIGVVGEDPAADQLLSLLRQEGVSETHWVRDSERPTTRKLRLMAGQHHLARIDYEKRSYLGPSTEKKILLELSERIPKVNSVILQDYGKGVFSEGLCQKVIQMAQEQGKKVLVDPHRTTPLRFYRGADLIKPNRDEAFVLSGLNLDDLRLGPESMEEVAFHIREKAQCEVLVVTQGKDGVLVLDKDQLVNVPTVSRQVFDVTGAGDTFLAAFSLAWSAGMTLVKSAMVANAASGVVVGKVGSVPCSRQELLQAFETYSIP